MFNIVLKFLTGVMRDPVKRHIALNLTRQASMMIARQMRNASYAEAQAKVEEIQRADRNKVREIYDEYKDQMSPGARQAFEEAMN